MTKIAGIGVIENRVKLDELASAMMGSPSSGYSSNTHKK